MFSHVPTGWSARPQQIVGNLEPHRQTWLNRMGHKTKQNTAKHRDVRKELQEERRLARVGGI